MKTNLLLTGGSIALGIFALCVKVPVKHEPIIEPIVLDNTNFLSKIMIPGLIGMVEFYSPDSVNCSAMDTVMENIARRFEYKALIGKVDIDQNSALRSDFNIQTVPIFVFLNSGQKIRQMKNVVPGDSLAGVIDSLILAEPKYAVTLDSSNFSTMIDVPGLIAMVEFYQDSCQYCRMMDTVVKRIARQYKDTALIAKVDALNDIPLQTKFNISTTPTFIFFNSDSLARRITVRKDRIITGDTLTRILDSLLSAR